MESNNNKYAVLVFEDRRARNVGIRELRSCLKILSDYEGVEELVSGIERAIDVLGNVDGCRAHYEAAGEIVKVRWLLGDNRELGGEKVESSDGRVRTFHAVLYWFSDLHSKVFNKCELLSKEIVADIMVGNSIADLSAGFDSEEDILDDELLLSA